MKIYTIDSEEFSQDINLYKDMGYSIYDLSQVLGGKCLPSTVFSFFKRGVMLSVYEQPYKMVYIRPV